MHEYSLVMSLIDRAEQEAKQRNAKSIVRISLRVGDSSGVEAALLEQAFEIARAGTGCEKAELVVKSEPSRWTCPRCNNLLDPNVSLRCLPCDSTGELTSGGELLLEQMEIEI
jgi:hydrogenase nickel incorporation protein HypA/HybF